MKITKKTTKLWFKSNDFSNENTFETLEKYLISIYENFKDIPKFLTQFSGSFGVQLVFNKASERPIIELTPKSI